MSNEELSNVIDKAEDEYQKLKDKVIEQGLEIERLNNIIEKLDNYVIADQMFEFGNTREEAEQYLQELKGSDKE